MDHFAGLDVSVKETSICIVENAFQCVAIARGAILRGRKTGWLSPEKTARTLIEICSPSTR